MTRNRPPIEYDTFQKFMSGLLTDFPHLSVSDVLKVAQIVNPMPPSMTDGRTTSCWTFCSIEGRKTGHPYPDDEHNAHRAGHGVGGYSNQMAMVPHTKD